MATTRCSSTSLSCARHSTSRSTVSPTSPASMSAASSSSASAAASERPGELPLASCEPLLSSDVRSGTSSLSTHSLAVASEPLAAAVPSLRPACTSGSDRRTLASGTICSTSVSRTATSGSMEIIFSSGTMRESASVAPTSSAQAAISRTCTSRWTDAPEVLKRSTRSRRVRVSSISRPAP